MFEAKVTTGVLDEVLDLADALVEEAVLQFSDDGLELRVMDRANVGMAVATVPADDFEEYETDGMRFGLTVSKFADILGMGGADAPVVLVFDEETRKMHIHVDNLEYTMALIDPESIQSAEEIPDLPFGAVVECPAGDLKRAIKAADMVSDHVTLEVKDGEFAVVASGDTDDVDYTADGADVQAGKDGSVEDCSSIFSLGYLQDISKAINASEVEISVADDMPVQVAFDLANSGGTGTVFLAPRISNN